jgi:hypothetical protein
MWGKRWKRREKRREKRQENAEKVQEKRDAVKNEAAPFSGFSAQAEV